VLRVPAAARMTKVFDASVEDVLREIER